MEVSPASSYNSRPVNFGTFKIDNKRMQRTTKFIESLSHQISRKENEISSPQHFEICNYLIECIKKMRDSTHDIVVGLYRTSKGAETFEPKMTLFAPDGKILKNVKLETQLEIIENHHYKFGREIKEVHPKFCEQIDGFISEALKLDKKAQEKLPTAIRA